jgi:hypothetical protein
VKKFHLIRYLSWSICVACLVLVAAPALAQQRPLLTEDPRLIPEGQMALENGIGYFNRARFPVSGLGGNLLSILEGGAHFGFGRAEFQMRGTLRNNLWVTEGGTGLRDDWGDGEVSTKIALVTELGRRPDVTFQAAVVLPNASNEDGLGTDGTNFFAKLLFGKSAGPAYFFGNLGLGILDDAERAAAQQDVLTYGLATIIDLSPRVRLAAEINGLTNPQSNPTLGGEDRAQTRFGIQWDVFGMAWDAGVTAGLTDLDHRVGFVFGTTKRFTLWQ